MDDENDATINELRFIESVAGNSATVKTLEIPLVVFGPMRQRLMRLPSSLL